MNPKYKPVRIPQFEIWYINNGVLQYLGYTSGGNRQEAALAARTLWPATIGDGSVVYVRSFAAVEGNSRAEMVGYRITVGETKAESLR